VDSDGKLKKELLSSVEKLSKKRNQYFFIWFEEALKKQRPIIIKCRPEVLKANFPKTYPLSAKVAKGCDLDGVIASSKLASKLMLGHDVDVYPISFYTESNFEQDRQRYAQGLPPFGQNTGETAGVLSDKEAKEVFIRIIKFAKWLRFYDKQIGRAKNLSGFRKGFDYLLTLWREHGHFADNVSCPVEIITSQAEPIYDSDNSYVSRKKLETNERNRKKLNSDLIEPLDRKFPWDVRLRIKADPENKFHARHLQAQQVIVHIDRGFDLFLEDGTFKRNHIRLDKMSRGHLKEYRDLPEP
jgi:hypothetical protein